jgi:hypothetical protein
VPLLTRDQALKHVDKDAQEYHALVAKTEAARTKLYDSLVNAHSIAKNPPTVRELAVLSGLSFGRVGQVLRGEYGPDYKRPRTTNTVKKRKRKR